jgi:hypothetical protein
LEYLEPRLVLDSGPLYISEFMADNTKTLRDEEQRIWDWVEVYNPTASTIALDGWYLTDSSNNLTQWQFPDTTANTDVPLAPGAYLVVFASGQDRRINPDTGNPVAVFHTNFKLDAGGEYLALVQPDGHTIASSYASKFPNQYADVSYGLSQDLLTQGYLVPATPGRAAESEPTPSLVTINEIMYHPGSGEPGTTGYTPENTNEEYVELYNGASGSLNLAGWELDRWWFGTEPIQRVSSIGYTGTTATVTLTLHGYNTGDWVQVSGAAPAEYNGLFQVTAVSPNVFTYTMSSSPGFAASGTVTAQKGVRQVASLTNDSYTATVTLSNHGFVDGDKVLITGAAQDAYNGVFTVSAATTNTFRYAMENVPTGAASGTVLLQRATKQMPNVSIAAGGYLVVAGDTATFRAKYPTVANFVAAWTPKLSDSSETLELRNAQDVVVSKVTYADEGDWATRSRGEQKVTSITRSSTTATVTLPYHSYATGNTIRIAGANEAAFNGEFSITVINRDTFTFSISTSAPAAATGTEITAQYKDYNHYGWDWYSPSDGHGYSLELINPQMKVNQGQNWGASTILGGTPGVANSIAATNIAPLITDVEQDTPIPTSSQAVTVTAHVTDEVTTGVSANLYYRADSRAADGLGADQAVTTAKSISGVGAKTVTSITRSGTTATVTSTGHGFANGTVIVLTGAEQAEYNGSFTITSVSTNAFAITVAATAPASATGSILTGKLAAISRSGTTATVTLAGHGFVNGQTVYVGGAAEAEYNGYYTISNVNANTFTYTVSSAAAASATGPILVQSVGLATRSTLTSITRSGTTATATLANHYYVNGQTVLLSGGGQAEYNGAFTIFNITANTFDFTVAGTAVTPATGTFYSQPYGISANGPTAIVSLPSHGYAVGSWVTIGGANQPEYNGTFRVSSTTTNTFTYTISGTPTSPAAGLTSAIAAKTSVPTLSLSNGTVTSLTRSGTTVTVTLFGHGFSNGNSIRISGAAQPEYNGTFTIGGVATNTFTYTISTSTAPSPATGTITAVKAVTSISRSSTTATVTLTGHGYAAGNWVVISGAAEADYNGAFQILAVPSSSTFTYAIASTAASSASGTISVTRAGLTRSGSTVTVSLPNHGLVNGQGVLIVGAAQEEYNGYYPITYVNSNTFTYTITGTPISPATGVIFVQPEDLATRTTVTPTRTVSGNGTTATVTSLLRSGNTVTVTLANHGFVNGQTVIVAGATPAGYNGTFVIAYVDSGTFTYTVTDDTLTAPSGTITAQPTGLGTKSTVTTQKSLATPGTAQTPTSITRSDYVVEVTLAGHGFINGQTVLISGADQAAYNGYFPIHWVSTSVFTYTLTSLPAAPTGTITVRAVGLGTKVTLSSITRSGSTATATLANHGYINGQTLILSGAGQGEYNGTFSIFNVTTNTFDFNVSVIPITPATGTLSAQPYAISRSGSTVIVAAPSHGFAVGDMISISGVEQADYNGVFAISSATTNSFTYTITGTPASPGTGTITAVLARVTRSGSTVTVTLANHGYAAGQTVLMSGAAQPEYNGAFVITGVTANAFTYTISGTPVSPAAGTISAQPYGISRSDSTVYVSLTAHGYSTGDQIYVAGATPSSYNGTYPITVLSANTFSYTIAGTPSFPATGTVTTQPIRVTRSGTEVTVTLPNHGYAAGQSIVISGASQSEYNGTYVITGATPNTFTYTIPSATQAATATGTISVQPYTVSRSGSTVIVSMASHGYLNGALLEIRGALQSEYNGVFEITVLSTNTFSYTITGTPSSPATGAITTSYAGIRRSGSTVTVPLANHGFAVGQTVRINNAGQAEYNGTVVITAVTPNTFSYTISSVPISPATGATSTTSPIVTTFGLVRTGSTVMAYSPGHGYASGDTVVIEGANEIEYNGTYVIANVTPSTFTYTISGTPTSPATGWASISRPWTQVTMLDDGLHGDGAAGDGVFGASIPAQANGAIVEFYVQAGDSGSRTRTWPSPAAFTGQQRANVLYQVDDSYDASATWTAGSAAVYRLIMTAAERNELAYIGYRTPDSASNATMNGTFISVDGTGLEIEYQAGIRNRGHGSRTSTSGANNYKVTVPHDHSWNGIESTLINFQNPYSQVLGSALWQSAGLAGPDQIPVQVRIDGVNKALTGGGMYGYYTGKEEYGDDFLARAYPDDPDGNLYSVYRGTEQGDLRYEGTSASAYRDTYFKQTNTVEDDWSDLIHMTYVLNNAAEATFYEEVSQVIDVEQFMRYLALDILVGNGETGLTMGYGDDYGLYRGANDTRFKLVPWDLDSLCSRGATGYDILTDYKKLTGIARLLTNPVTLKMYYEQLLDLINGVLAPANFNPLVDRTLTGWVPASQIASMKSYIAARTAYVLTLIPRSFTVSCTLPTVGGYPQTTDTNAPLTGTADVSTTRSVTVNGQVAQWNPTTGAWTLGTAAAATPTSFQEGVSSYTGTLDTYIRSYAPTTAYGGATSLNFDGEDDDFGVSQALIRFQNLFGGGTGQIPLGATITSASLVLNVSNNATTALTVNRMLVDWNESSTWSTFGGDGIQANNTEAAPTADYSASSNATGTWTIDVSASLRAWSAGAANYGWVILPLGTNGCDFDSSETATLTNRPQLTVTYTMGGASGGVTLSPGLNRVMVRTYDGPNGTGTKVRETSIDIWRETGAYVTVPGGHITTNTVWNPANGVYHVTGDLFVDAGATLTVLPGTTVYFDTDTGLTVTGRLVAEGTADALIRFTRTPGSTMADGLHFLNTMEDNRVTYAIVEYGERLYAGTTTDRALIALDAANLTLDHVTLDHARYRRIRTVDSSLIVRNSTFTNIFGPGEAPASNNNSEQIWGKNALAGGHLIIQNNWFGTTEGHNDILDIDGGLRANGDPVPQILGNTFTGGGDDACDLEGDFVIAGNTFMNFNKDGYHTSEEGEGNCLSGGDSHLVGHEYWVIGNVYYNVAHMALIKGNSFGYFLNNTVVNVNKAAIYFEVPGDSNAPGRGAYIDGTVFVNTPWMFDQLKTETQLTINRSILPAEWLSYGVGNTAEAARLVYPAKGDFTLGPGSPALGTGPNGIDMGALVSIGASISGEPAANTRSTSATLAVAGPGILTYKYRINEGAWSSEIAVGTPITLTGLAEGTYTVYVQGKNAAGTWQITPTASKTWTVSNSLRRVQINEVLAINNTAVEHEGTYPDLIELINSGAVAVDLSGMTISNDNDSPAKYVFPAGTVLGAGEYLVLFADDADTATSGIHLGFELDGDRGNVYLFETVANNYVIVDSINYGKQIADLSIGRVGHDATWALTQPTFSMPNLAARTGNPATLHLNEWFTNGDLLLNNDFVELYNPDPLPVPLAGLYLTDNPVTEADKYEFPALSFVAGSGYVSFVADDNNGNGSSHLNFNLSTGKEWIALLDDDLQTIDRIVHYGQTTDVSQGAATPGGASYTFFAIPTPGTANTVPATVTSLLAGLRVSEIMYHPAGDGDLEFLEIVNAGPTTLNLAGVRLSGAVDFTFPNALLAPGQYAVVVRDMGKFAERFGSGINVLGEYDGKLSDGGDSIVLQPADPYDAAILRFDFNDTWYPVTDGGGYSLTIVDAAASAGSWDSSANWQAGSLLGGSPGRADGGTIAVGVVINEILSHTDEPLSDAIELYNTTDAAIDISGWYLSDAAGLLEKFRIPDGTLLAAHGYLVFYQGHWENHVLVSADNEFGAGTTGFALSSYDGDQVWLSATDSAGNILRVVDYVDFPAMANGESIGRWPNATGSLHPLQHRTLTAPNNDNASNTNGPRVGPVVISEILYAPTALTPSETTAGFASVDDMEYVEIHNPTGEAIELAHWHLDAGVNFDFAAGTWLTPYGTLVAVPFDPANATMLAAFRTRYGMSSAVTVVGPYSGHLSDTGERVVLQDSDEPPLEAPTYWPPLIEDEVSYSSTIGANGNGQALARVSVSSWGMSTSSWAAATATPGTFGAVPLAAIVIPLSPSLRNAAVSTLDIVFNQAVTGFDVGDLRLTFNGGANLLNGSQTLTSTDNTHWTLTNLDGLTALNGTYVLTLVASGSGIQTAQSSPLTADASTTWTLDATAPTAALGAVTPSPRNSAVSQIQIVFSEAVSGLDLADLRLTLGGGANLITAGQTLVSSDSITWTLGNLAGLTGAEGSYQLTVLGGSGILDAAGNPLAADATTAWSTDTTLPSAQITAVSPTPRTSAVGELQIVFSEVVAGFDLADLRLTRNGTNVLTGGESLATSDQTTWTLSGLAGLTGAAGSYTLSLVAAGSGIVDTAGNALSGDANTSWTLDLTAPTVTIASVTPNPRDTAVSQLTITFSEAVEGLTAANLSLTLNGGANLLTGSQSLTTSDHLVWTLGDLAALTAAEGHYSLTLLASGITDAAGNALPSGATTTWTFARTSLDADGNGTADALTDGILILRYLFAPAGTWSYADAVGTGATRTDRAAIRAYLDAGRGTMLDADGNGTADALTDGILILRYLFAPTGTWSFADAVGTGATRTSREAIRTFLNNYNSAFMTASLNALVAADGFAGQSAALTTDDTAEPVHPSNSLAAPINAPVEQSTAVAGFVSVAADTLTDASSASPTVVETSATPDAEATVPTTGISWFATDSETAPAAMSPSPSTTSAAADAVLEQWAPESGGETAYSATDAWPDFLDADSDPTVSDESLAAEDSDRFFTLSGDLL